jgi:hypothetical protein
MSLLPSDQFVWPGQPLPHTVGSFIHQMAELAELGETLDFTMDYVAQLCQTEPENCAWLLDTLVGRGGGQEGSYSNKLSEQHEVYSDITNENDNYNHKVINKIKEDGLKTMSLLGPPRHILMLVLIPFFPVMLLFTASGGLAFFVTAGIEFIARLVQYSQASGQFSTV